MKFISFIFLSLVISTTTSVCINLAPTSAETLNSQEIEQLALMIKKKTTIPVLIPSVISWTNSSTIYVSYSASKDSYTIQFSSEPSCSATFCTIGRFSGFKGKNLDIRRDRVRRDRGGFTYYSRETVQLTNGIEGVFIKICGANCWAELQWMQDGVRYEVFTKRSQEDAPDVAKSAIQAGAR